MRRRPLVGPRRGPSLVGTVARTAVIAGTATAVSQGVSNAGKAKAQARQQQQAAQDAAFQAQADVAQMQEQLAAVQAQQAQQTIQAQAKPTEPAAPAAIASPDFMTQLQQLGQMREASLLTDAEFTSAKARLLRGVSDGRPAGGEGRSLP
jgi:hypothetical protein